MAEISLSLKDRVRNIPLEGMVLTQVTPESILNRVEGDAVARNGCAAVVRMR